MPAWRSLFAVGLAAAIAAPLLSGCAAEESGDSPATAAADQAASAPTSPPTADPSPPTPVGQAPVPASAPSPAEAPAPPAPPPAATLSRDPAMDFDRLAVLVEEEIRRGREYYQVQHYAPALHHWQRVAALLDLYADLPPATIGDAAGRQWIASRRAALEPLMAVSRTRLADREGGVPRQLDAGQPPSPPPDKTQPSPAGAGAAPTTGALPGGG
ncbi:MAG: hypothetical protein HY719_07145 [Planctomycetes bacterium]|nr:hypothetical protein [Planctomycetota bacterium]